MISEALLSKCSYGFDSISDEAERAVRLAIEKAWGEGLSVAQVREVAIEAIVAASDEYGAMTREMACALFESETGQAASYVTQPTNRETVESSVRYYAGSLKDGTEEGLEKFVKSCTARTRLLTRRCFNEAVIESCAASAKSAKRRKASAKAGHKGVRFARVPRGGDTCTFCAMLASRGFVYWSRKTAGEFNHYHLHCRCTIVPDDGSGEVEGYDPTEWYARWKAYEEIDGRGDLTARQKADLKGARSGAAILRTRADPALDYFGPAEEDDPEALARIKADLEASGVEVVVSPRDREAIGYGPSPRPGAPGSIHVTEGMSLSAWLHEYKHFCQDRDFGFPPSSFYFTNDGLRVSMEREAYGAEIERAAGHGYNELVEKLQDLLDEEMRGLDGWG